jgi:glycosyltransferase involved in cell wall biosynthesis
VLIVAHAMQLPPYHAGGAQVLSRVLGPIAGSDYVTVSFDRGPDEPKLLPELPGRRYLLDTDWVPVLRGPRYPLKTVRAIRRYLAEALRRGRILAGLARRERCAAILVTSTSTPDVLAAAACAWLARIPLVLYLLDDWHTLVAAANPPLRHVARLAEPWLLRRAAATMVISPVLAADLERDYGIRPIVVNHPVPDETFMTAEPPDLPWPHQPGQISICFTGRVYDAHWDPLINVLKAIELPGLENVTLHLYTGTSARDLEAHGVRGRMVLHAPLPLRELRQVQREADILLLPLGFATPYPEIVRTAVPTKTAEYLAAARPILVHAPANSFVATLATHDGAAALVSSPDPAAVAAQIRRIVEDARYRSDLIVGAHSAALRYHAPGVTVARFREVLDRVMLRAASGEAASP